MTNITTFDPLRREYPVLMAKTIRRTIASATNPDFKFAADDDLKDAVVIGFCIRRDSATRLSAGGNALINDTLLVKGFLNIKASGHDDVYQIPLEWLVHEQTLHQPGTYAQFMIVNWDLEKSGVSFANATGAVVGEDFEMTVVYLTKRHCDLPAL